MGSYNDKLHHTFTLFGAIFIGFSFLFDNNVFWIFLGVGIVLLIIGATAHAIRHHRRKHDPDHYAVPHSEPVYVTPIQQPTYPQTYQYQMPPPPTGYSAMPTQYPIPAANPASFKSPYQQPTYGSTPYAVGTPYNPSYFNDRNSPS